MQSDVCALIGRISALQQALAAAVPRRFVVERTSVRLWQRGRHFGAACREEGRRGSCWIDAARRSRGDASRGRSCARIRRCSLLRRKEQPTRTIRFCFCSKLYPATGKTDCPFCSLYYPTLRRARNRTAPSDLRAVSNGMKIQKQRKSGTAIWPSDHKNVARDPFCSRTAESIAPAHQRHSDLHAVQRFPESKTYLESTERPET